MTYILRITKELIESCCKGNRIISDFNEQLSQTTDLPENAKLIAVSINDYYGNLILRFETPDNVLETKDVNYIFHKARND